MKVNSVRSSRAGSRSQRGFTLIEMIGVLAVIAILAAVLIPKVFEAINNSRISNSAMTCNSMKTGCIDHYAKFGTFPVDGSGATPVALTIGTAQTINFDTILLKEQLIDKPFQVKIGDGLPENGAATTTRVEIIAAPATTDVGATGVTGVDNGMYNLSGGTAKDDISGTWLVQAVITGVAAADAAALNKAIDGTATTMGVDANGNDYQGRVVYAAPAAAGGTTTVYVYLTHR